MYKYVQGTMYLLLIYDLSQGHFKLVWNNQKIKHLSHNRPQFGYIKKEKKKQK